MPTYFAYIRVSTIRQGEHGVSLEEQRSAIANYAKEHGLEISHWFEEQLTAAKKGRPVFNRMLGRLRDGEAQGLLIHAIDRSVRNLWDWASLGELIDQGIDVRFVKGGVDLRGRGGRLAADIQAVVSADYVRNLKEETLKGFYGRLKQGYYPLKAPVGYINNGSGKLATVCPTKGPLVQKAFELYATGTFTLGMLSNEVSHLGLHNGRGTKFSDNGMSAILNNTFYMGLIRIRKTNETFPGAHKPLVSKSLFDRVQDVLHGRTQKRVRKHDFLYRGVLQCSECTRYLVGERQRGRVYYRCHQRHEPPVCVSERKVDALLEEKLKAMSPLEFDQLFANMPEPTGREDIQNLNSRLDNVQKRLTRLAEVFHERLIDQELYWSRKNAYHLERIELEERIHRANARKQQVKERLCDPSQRMRRIRALTRSEKRQIAPVLLADYAK